MLYILEESVIGYSHVIGVFSTFKNADHYIVKYLTDNNIIRSYKIDNLIKYESNVKRVYNFADSSFFLIKEFKLNRGNLPIRKQSVLNS